MFGKIIAGTVAVLLTLSLFLPVAYGAEIFGVMPGFLVLVLPPLTLLYVPVPVSFLPRVRRNRAAALGLAALSCVGWGYVLATNGAVIDAFLSHRRIPATGTICALTASVLAACYHYFWGSPPPPSEGRDRD